MTYLYAGAVIAVLGAVVVVLLVVRRRRLRSMSPLEIAKAASRAAAAESRRATRPNLRGEGSGDLDLRWSGHDGGSGGVS